jgi:type VI secretion system secreted protein VgrG
MSADQSQEILEAQIESGDFACDQMRVRKLSGKEAISRLFRFELEVLCLDPDGPGVDDIAGARLTLVFLRAGLEVRRIHGMIAEVEDLFASGASFKALRIVLVPTAFRLTLIETSDIFTRLSVPGIVKQKLDLVRLTDDVEMRLAGSYPEREFVVQYNETDFAFVCRLLEHLGISFFFEHGDKRDKIVFTDHAGGFARSEDRPTLGYRSRGEERDVFHFSARKQLIPGYYAVRDYNYRTPQFDLTSEHQLATGHSGGAIEYGGHFKTVEEGAALVRARAEERLSSQLVYSGRSDLVEICAGCRHELAGHPDLDSTSLLVVEVEHTATFLIAGGGSADKSSYNNRFSAIPADRTYRPPRTTPGPRMTGLVTGIVEAGVSGSDKMGAMDEQGRYFVRFLFDTTPPGQREPSRPVRMLQNHAGENYGTHFPLRAGTEVLIGFVNGDPDRPVIVGAVPNPTKPSPVVANTPGLHRIKTETGITIDLLER